MDKLRCILVDDEPLARKVLKNYIENLDDLILEKELKSALELKDHLAQNSCDIVFLDISKVPLYVSGISMVPRLLFKIPSPMITFEDVPVTGENFIPHQVQ